MVVLIILGVLAVFFINLFFIDNIYRIVEPIKPTNNKDDNLYGSIKEALILGDNGICLEISDLLNKNNISSDIINNIDNINKSYPYKYLLAVFDDDLENLTACSIASKIMGIKNIIAICNKQYNKKIYDENHIFSLKKDASASEITFLLLNTQNKREA